MTVVVIISRWHDRKLSACGWGPVSRPMSVSISNAGIGSTAAGKAAVAAGATMVVLVLILNVPGNALVELRHHRVPGMLLSHAGIAFLTVPFWPALCRIRPNGIARSRFARWLAVAVLGSAGCMLLLIAA